VTDAADRPPLRSLPLIDPQHTDLGKRYREAPRVLHSGGLASTFAAQAFAQGATFPSTLPTPPQVVPLPLNITDPSTPLPPQIFSGDIVAFDDPVMVGDWSVTAGSPTPVPAALPLFATGLGAMGLLGWRRKRKAAPPD
jgi:hypothetical protein